MLSRTKRETCFCRSLANSTRVPFLWANNAQPRRHPTEATAMIASSEECGRQSVVVDPSWYLPLAHVKLACHRNRTRPAPSYRTPMYSESARLLCVVFGPNRLTYPQKGCQYPSSGVVNHTADDLALSLYPFFCGCSDT